MRMSMTAERRKHLTLINVAYEKIDITFIMHAEYFKLWSLQT